MRLRDCINVLLLVVILYCGFARCYHWDKLGKGYMASVYVTCYNGTRIYSDLKIKSLMNELKITVRYSEEKNTKQKSTKASCFLLSSGPRSTRIPGPLPWKHHHASPFPTCPPSSLRAGRYLKNVLTQSEQSDKAEPWSLATCRQATQGWQ